MKQATFTEVRNHAKQYFDIVESGDTVRVLRNGKPIADIVPEVPDLPSWKRRKAQPLELDSAGRSRYVLDVRHSGRDCRNPDAMDGIPKRFGMFQGKLSAIFPRVLPPCKLDSGNPCRNECVREDALLAR